MPREIRSVEASYFIHATEDAEKVARAVKTRLGLSGDPQLESLEGHFGNPIVRVRFLATGDEGMATFRRLTVLLGEEGLRALVAGIDLSLDEHKALYVRLDKQEFLRGSSVLSSDDPIRIKVKPHGYVRGDPSAFYARLMGRRTE